MGMRTKVPWLITIFVIGSVIGLLIYSARLSKKNDAEAQAVLTPYFAAISQGRFTDAWNYYSEDRKKHFSAGNFAAHYEKVQAQEGAYLRHNIYAARSSYNPFRGKSALNVDCQIFFTGRLIAVTYVISADESHRPRITSAVATSGGYARQSLPW